MLSKHHLFVSLARPTACTFGRVLQQSFGHWVDTASLGRCAAQVPPLCLWVGACSGTGSGARAGGSPAFGEAGGSWALGLRRPNSAGGGGVILCVCGYGCSAYGWGVGVHTQGLHDGRRSV